MSRRPGGRGRPMIPLRTCSECNCGFTPRDSRNATCSLPCSKKRKIRLRAARFRSLPEEKKESIREKRRVAKRVHRQVFLCVVCGAHYVPRHKNCKTCSPACRATAKRRYAQSCWLRNKPAQSRGICVVCGAGFGSHRPKQKTCGNLDCRKTNRARWNQNRNAERTAALNIIRKIIKEGPEALL